jgi:hypothetical protein
MSGIFNQILRYMGAEIKNDDKSAETNKSAEIKNDDKSAETNKSALNTYLLKKGGKSMKKKSHRKKSSKRNKR